jgi:hypothetical protein
MTDIDSVNDMSAPMLMHVRRAPSLAHIGGTRADPMLACRTSRSVRFAHLRRSG